MRNSQQLTTTVINQLRKMYFSREKITYDIVEMPQFMRCFANTPLKGLKLNSNK